MSCNIRKYLKRTHFTITKTVEVDRTIKQKKALFCQGIELHLYFLQKETQTETLDATVKF